MTETKEAKSLIRKFLNDNPTSCSTAVKTSSANEEFSERDLAIYEAVGELKVMMEKLKDEEPTPSTKNMHVIIDVLDMSVFLVGELDAKVRRLRKWVLDIEKDR